ncbi:MAG: Eco57I restriction-modification methylase domain-containing protein [Ruminococcus sp.]
MIQLIDFESYPVSVTKEILLKDKATKQNIVWATNSYKQSGYEYSDNSPIQIHLISGINKWIVEPRVQKNIEQQQQRTKAKAEVFTPAWICNKMNNFCDEQWFETTNTFNTATKNSWETNHNKIIFKGKRTWKKYVDQRILEITCGEAPYLCSRYDMSDGQIIPIENRIGILDRKLRVINENTTNREEWYKWVIRAFQSCYGYEYQGDNLLIARINMLLSFYEYYEYRWKEQPCKSQLRKIANIISWNLWQMDGLKGTVPNGAPNKVNEQLRFGEFTNTTNAEIKKYECKLYNWRADRSLYYSDLKGVKRKMKFDFAIGNPPYQETQESTSDKPVYNSFMDATYEIAYKVELITPARFLFNAGKTPKAWNKKMLSDEHLRVSFYEQDSSKVFSNTDIKGGVVVTYRDTNKEFGAIDTFSAFTELNTIIRKLRTQNFKSFSNLVYAPESYRFTNNLYVEHPEIRDMIFMFRGKAVPLISKGHDYDLTSNIFEKLYGIVFFDKARNDGAYVQLLGRKDNNRVCYYVKADYISKHDNMNAYKVFLPKANGSGTFGEVLSDPLVGGPGLRHTQTFISLGAFKTKYEAESVLKYLKCKFTRAMLGVLKVTQDNKKSVWKYVPLQDFTENSDIDWSKSIHEIDLQLYKKYGLDETEIEFIEKNVKEMS